MNTFLQPEARTVSNGINRLRNIEKERGNRMKESKEIDIGLNKLAATIITVGLGSMGTMVAFGASTWWVVVPVLVVVAGLAICTRSFWWRR